jgi:amino acid permease
MTDSIGIHHEKTPLVARTRPQETTNSPTPIASGLAIPASLSAENVVTGYYTTPSPSGDNCNTRVDGDRDSESDDYIVSLIRRTSTLHHDGINDEINDGGEINENETAAIESESESKRGQGKAASMSSSSSSPSLQGTTWGQTVVHLVKGYIGCGILSLPWAISQLGIPLGLMGILLVSVWTSYNCWTVTKIKQYIERSDLREDDEDEAEDDSDSEADDETSSRRNGSRNSSRTGTSVASCSNATTTTYPDVGEWAYGRRFHNCVAVCICAQQLAICTVFLSFVGENLEATLRYLDWNLNLNWNWNWNSDDSSLGNNEWDGNSIISQRSLLTTLSLPVFLGLSCGMPTVKSMFPLMVLGSILMLSGFSILGWIGVSKWDDRPGVFNDEQLPALKLDGNAPMALCGILYSFEGICIILPVESSMRHPTLEFRSAFGCSMVVVTIVMCGMAGCSVLVFGEVTNGSITAFLLDEYGDDDPAIASKTVLSNLLITLSIIVSYPLMLYPAVELIAPVLFDWTETTRRRRAQERARKNMEIPGGSIRYKDNNEDNDDGDGDDEDSLGFDEDSDGFERMAGIPEHMVASMRSLPSLHEYDANGGNHNETPPNPDLSGNTVEADASSSSQQQKPKDSNASSSIDTETIKTGEAMDGGGGMSSESVSLLSRLSSNMSYQRSIVESSVGSDEQDDDDGMPTSSSLPRQRKHRREGDNSTTAFEWVLPGDSPILRAGLVLATYLVAILVPNVQSLVSLVGAVTGSSTALLIPPILQLAYIRHMEAKEATGRLGSLLMGDWEGGPSIASKRMLFGNSPKIYHRYSSGGSSPRHKKRRPNKDHLWDRILSWCLLILGSMFALIGSYFSVRDILQSYYA